MRTVRLTVTKSACRSGYCKQGDSFVVKDLCPPLCHEFWNSIYPSVYALLNGALLDYGEQRATQFDAKCPDGGRVCIHGAHGRKSDRIEMSFCLLRDNSKMKHELDG